MTQPTALAIHKDLLGGEGCFCVGLRDPIVTPNLQNAFMLEKVLVFGYLVAVICMTL